MRDGDVIGMVVVIVIFAIVAATYIALIVLGVSIAKRKNRSPHWMWFAVHPVGLLITLIVMACLSPLKRCPNCAQTTQQYARLCGFCGYSYETPGAYMPPPPPPSAYAPPQHY
jgi:ABC-type multidrug transport system permease subunit